MQHGGWRRRVWLRLSRSREFSSGALLLCALVFLARLEWRRDGARHAALLQLYTDAASAQHGSVPLSALCLRGVGVPRDVLGEAASSPVPLHAQPLAVSVRDAPETGQFRRLPRVGARGYGPSLLHYNVFASGFDGDFVMSRGKYMRRVPFSRVHVPRPMPGCASPDAQTAAALPEPCDREAALAGRPGQGYVEVGTVTQAFLAALPERDTLNNGAQWRTCAVVGGGGGGDASAGSVIDAADTVIRMGLPPPSARGDQATLGRRTNVRILGPADVAASASGTERGEEAWQRAGTVGAQPYTILHVLISETALNATLRWQQANPLADVALADGDFMQLALDRHAGRAPSTAFYALLLAAERCERVMLFGFTCAGSDGGQDQGEGGAEGAKAVREEERLTRALLATKGDLFRFYSPPQTRARE